MDAADILADYVHVSRYARWIEEEGRRETWSETVTRYMDFMREHLKEKHAYEMPQRLYDELWIGIHDLQVMPSMRALMTAGEALKRDNVAAFNPVAGETRVPTKEYGEVPIEELEDRIATVLNVNGDWVPATFTGYGEQEVVSVNLRLNSNTKMTVRATENHRWVLQDGTVVPTSVLAPGDRIPFVSGRKEVDTSSIDYRLGVLHGLIYGDGTTIKRCERNYGYRIRICKDHDDLNPWFADYQMCTPPSAQGDPIFHMFDDFAKTHGLKDLPDPDETEDYLVGFIRGWIATDGSVTATSQVGICCAKEGRDWLYKYASRLGYVIQNEYLFENDTNYGKRNKPTYKVTFSRSSLVPEDFITSRKRNNFRPLESHYVVHSLERNGEKTKVYCAEVPETNTFVLSGGLVTGNCAYLTVDSIDSFVETMAILLCGTGVGFSVEKRYVEQLPVIPEQFTAGGTLIVRDSKEGWSQAFRSLLVNLYAGIVPEVDYSKVRPAGARLKTFGGRASGPEPLKALFDYCITLFKKAAGRKLTTLEAHDIMCYVAKIVVVGGVRRSAMISLQDLDDIDLRMAKVGEFWVTHPERALSNNSAVYDSKPSRDLFDAEWQALIASGTGERGIFNREASREQAWKVGRDEAIEYGTNPCCVTGDTPILTWNGYIRIQEVVGQEVHIWNGEEWAPVTPYRAGKGYIYIVELSDGRTLECTANHRWVMEGHVFTTTEQIRVGDKIQKFNIPADDVRKTYVFPNHPEATIKSVTKTNRFEDVYCFTEPKTSRGTFGGIVTGNSEIILRPFQFCNLSEIVVRADDTIDDLLRKSRLAAILGTFQSTLTYFPNLRPIWTKNTEAERLLGVSMTGIMDNEITNGSKGEEVLTHTLYSIRREAFNWNREYAWQLGIPPSAAVTCVKPSGTVSQRVNSASGIHARHSPYYIRAVRGDAKDPLTQFMMDAGIPNEPCAYGGDAVRVFYFPIKSPEGAIFRKDRTAIQQLELWLLYQRHYTEHKPSVTISVKDEEWKEVGDWVYDHFDEISGISFLPYSDAVYVQAPYQEVDKETYEAALAKFPKHIDWQDLRKYEFSDTTTGAQELACVAGGCEI